MNVVLMAGGGGTRLWPLSRISKPKQFLDLGSGKTLIELAYQRACRLTDPSNIYVATAQAYAEQINHFLPTITAGHIFFEPEKRDTTAAFASVALRLINLQQGDEPTIFMWSDHIFTAEDAFLKDLARIPEILSSHPDSLVIMAHNPLSPETTLGYVEMSNVLTGYQNVYQVKQFTEKPDLDTAISYIASGRHYWNLGYFSLRPTYLIQQLKEYNPEINPVLDAFSAALLNGQIDQQNKVYGEFPKISIEYTFVEKTSSIIALVGDYGWSDIGNWNIVKDIFGKKGDHMPHGHHIHVDSKNNYIYNTTSKTVSLIGLEDVIVVVTDDAILITPTKEAHKVKEVVKRLSENKKTDVL